MARPVLSSSPYTDPKTNVTLAWFNAPHSAIATAVNNINHDPGDSTNGWGGSIPQWGPTNTAMYAAHGPGAVGTDWGTAYNNTAAIPADPTQSQISPTTNITAAMGVAAELQALRGAFGQLLQNDPTGATNPWNHNIGLIQLALINPAAAQTGNLNVTGNVTAGQFVSNIAQGSPPLSSTSTTMCPNVTAQYLADSASANAPRAASSVGGTAHSILVTNTNGFYPQAFIDADLVEASTNDTLVNGTSTLLNNLNRLRNTFLAIPTAAGLTSPQWNQMPTTLQTSTTWAGSKLWGDVNVVIGSGLIASISGQNVTLQASGFGTAAGDPFDSMPTPYVLTGLGVTANAGISATIAIGTAYIANNVTGNAYAQLTAPVTLTGAQLLANSDNYVDYLGGQGISAFLVRSCAIGGTPAAAASNVATISKITTGAASITSITDISSRYVNFGARGFSTTALQFQTLSFSGPPTATYPAGTILQDNQGVLWAYAGNPLTWGRLMLVDQYGNPFF